jgi:Animal haem peroxidase
MNRLFPALAPLEGDDGALDGDGGALDGDGGALDGDGGALVQPTAARMARAGDRRTDASAAAGWPFFAQFVAHDITSERALADRPPRADLTCVYGSGPAGSPFLYQRDDPAKLLIGLNDAGEAADLPRNAEGIALIADPRNDAQLFVSQLHLAMLRLHNAFVDRLRADGVDEHDLFDAAARETRWHYQWVIVSQYLPATAGAKIVNEVLSEGPRLYLRDSAPYIPLEFSDGAFRYRDGQIRDAYLVNRRSGELAMGSDMVGFRPVPAHRAVDWALMFDTPGAAPAQRARRIDGTLVAALANGGSEAFAHRSPTAGDRERNGVVGLPPGEEVARAAGERPLTPGELGLAVTALPSRTPLWRYVMLESAARADGDRLGPVGGRIVAEVLLGLLDADPGSYLCADRGWRPRLGTRRRFGIADLLAFPAGIG